MNPLIRFFRKLQIFLSREKFQTELEEEMAFHREQMEKELQANGKTSEDASYAARRQFGNTTWLKEQNYEIVGFQLETVLQDFRFAVRQLRKNPGFALTAIVTLALGACASLAIFAFVDAALIKPLPYPNPNTLVAVTESAALIPRAQLSYPDYLDWKKLNTVFSSIAAYTGRSYTLRTDTGMELASGAQVSDDFFRTLGIAPFLGRDFYAGEDLPGVPGAVILSYAAWQERFGGRNDAIGQTVTLSGATNVIVGVLPQSFQFAPKGKAEFWMTFASSNGCGLRRGCHNLNGVARLKDGVSIEAAAAHMRLIAQQLESQYPETNRGQGASVVPLSEVIVGDVRPILLMLLGGAGLLLLIAALNVASLLLVRAESRKREVAVRGALGASAARLIRQFTTEGLVLVGAGCALGLLSAGSIMQLLTGLIPADMLAGMPYVRGLGLNVHVLAFAGAISLLASVLFTLIPTVRLRLRELRPGLAEGGRGSAGTVWRRFGSNLVVVELSVAMVLLVGAGLLGKSLYRLLHVDLGFQPDHLATLQIAVPRANYAQDEQVVALGRRIVSSASSLPGVRSVATAMQLPVTSNDNTLWVRFVGRPYNGEHNEVLQRDVSSGYFTTLQAKLLRGRYFADAEDATKPKVVVVNHALAEKYFPGEDPIGKKIGDYLLSPKSIVEIVGVVEDIREGSLDSDIWPAVYYPENQNPDSYFSLIVRTEQAEQSTLAALRDTIHQIDPGLATTDEAIISQRINDSPSAYQRRSSALLVGGFAFLALLLSVVGLYGVVTYSVGQRIREIGVRLALGAQPRSIYQLILREAAWLTSFGIGAGLVCSLVATMLMRKLLFGVKSWDISTLLSVAALLSVSALLAGYVPARRAASLNPAEVLRAE